MRMMAGFRLRAGIAWAVGLAILLGTPLVATAQDLEPRDILTLKVPSDPQISPSGDRVAYVLSGFNDAKARVARIWWVNSDGGHPKPLVEGDGQQRIPRWSPDGARLAFASIGAGGTPTQLVLRSIATGKDRVLLSRANGLREMRWSPDGSSIAFLELDPDTTASMGTGRVVGVHDRHIGLWMVNVANGNRRRLSPEGLSFWSCRWSPDGTRIVGLASDLPTPEGQEYRSRVVVIDLADGKISTLAHRANPQAAPSFSRDGASVAYMGPVGDFKERGIPHVVSTSGGKPKSLLRHHAGHAWDLRWHPTNGNLLAGLTEGPRSYLIELDPEGDLERLIQLQHSMIPYWRAVWSISADGSQVAFLSEEDSQANEVWIGQMDGSRSRRLTNLNPQTEDIALGRVEVVRWKNDVDGATVEGVAVTPPGFTFEETYPLVVWLHGGPAYNWGEGRHLDGWSQLLAANGYLVLLPNFRGSSGYGMDWMMANVRDWGDGPLSDVMSGVDYLIEVGVVDPNRLFIGGGSFGGYLSFWALTQTDRFRAGFVRAGISDVATEYALTDEPSYLVGYYGATPYEKPGLYKDASPLTWVEYVKTPLLIIHGEQDARVPLEQGLRFHDALRHLGSTVEMVVYPGEGHSIRGYDHRMNAMNRLLDWFKRWDSRPRELPSE